MFFYACSNATLKTWIRKSVCVLVCDVVLGLQSRCPTVDPACTRSCQHLWHKCAVLCVSWNQSLKKEYIVDHYLAARIVLWHLKQQCEVMPRWPLLEEKTNCFTWDPDPYPEGSCLLFLGFNIFPSAGRNWKNWIKTCGYLDFASLFDWISTDWAMFVPNRMFKKKLKVDSEVKQEEWLISSSFVRSGLTMVPPNIPLITSKSSYLDNQPIV